MANPYTPPAQTTRPATVANPVPPSHVNNLYVYGDYHDWILDQFIGDANQPYVQYDAGNNQIFLSDDDGATKPFIFDLDNGFSQALNVLNGDMFQIARFGDAAFNHGAATWTTLFALTAPTLSGAVQGAVGAMLDMTIVAHTDKTGAREGSIYRCKLHAITDWGDGGLAGPSYEFFDYEQTVTGAGMFPTQNAGNFQVSGGNVQFQFGVTDAGSSNRQFSVMVKLHSLGSKPSDNTFAAWTVS